MHRRKLGLLVGGLVAAIALTGSSSAVAGQTAADQKVGGTVLFGQDQEPRTLNSWIVEGNLFATTEVYASLFDAGLRFNEKGQLTPLLMEAKPQIVKTNPFTVRFRYKAAAKWSDGTQITGKDLRFLVNTVMAKDGANYKWDITSRTGYEDIRAVQGNGKQVTVVFNKPYAGYEVLLGSGPIPAHALEGENFNQLWRNDTLNPKTKKQVGSGPYMFESWQRGQQLTVARNPNYWGKKALLAKIIYRQVPNTQTQFQALRAGELNVLRPQFQTAIAEIQKDKRFTVQMGPEYQWEHLDFQQGPQGHPALKKKYVREAIVTAINRQQIANNLFKPVVDKLPVLQSTMYKNFEQKYKNIWGSGKDAIVFSQKNAINLLRQNGCTGGPARPTAGNRDIYSCPEVGKLEFRYTTNLGANERRALMYQIIQQQLRSVGIQINADPVPGLQPRLSGSNWDIFNFAWVGSPTSSYTAQLNVYGCGRPQNWMFYCNQQVTRLLGRVEATVNEAQRDKLILAVDELLSKDIPTLPIFAAPGFAIHRTNVKGVLRNPTQASLFWNAGAWSLG